MYGAGWRGDLRVRSAVYYEEGQIAAENGPATFKEKGAKVVRSEFELTGNPCQGTAMLLVTGTVGECRKGARVNVKINVSE